MQTTLTAQDEDKIAELLSNLTPIAYAQLMVKVKRDHWKLTGPNMYSPLKYKERK